MGLTRLILICIYSLGFCYGVPQEYCFHRLNKSNCDVAPTPVFTYYHEGSRCEIEFWRGCPTMNKFADEIECSVSCIGDLRFDLFSSEENAIDDGHSHNRCHENLNPPTCKGDKNITVFTYDSIAEKCVEDTWTGCNTLNKFETKEECEKECIDEIPLPQKLKVLDKTDAEDINKIIDEVTKDETTIASHDSQESGHTTKADSESAEDTTQTAGDADEILVDRI